MQLLFLCGLIGGLSWTPTTTQTPTTKQNLVDTTPTATPTLTPANTAVITTTPITNTTATGKTCATALRNANSVFKENVDATTACGDPGKECNKICYQGFPKFIDNFSTNSIIGLSSVSLHSDLC